jgi:hypothetical protein
MNKAYEIKAWSSRHKLYQNQWRIIWCMYAALPNEIWKHNHASVLCCITATKNPGNQDKK